MATRTLQNYCASTVDWNRLMIIQPNERAGGRGGIPPLFHAARCWPDLPQHWRCHFRCMNRIAAILLLGLTGFLAGCAKPDVKYSDLSPATTATVSGDTVTIHLGSDLTASACWTRPKARVDGRTVYVVGYRTLKEQSREFAVHLPPSASSEPVSVVWVDPDGSRVTVSIRK